MSMIQENKQLTEISVGELMIPSEKVAHVQVNNPLEHALLVLVKSGYSAVPVLDASYKLTGIIGKTMILNNILGLERIETEKLSELKVEEVMKRDIPTLTKDDNVLDGLNAVINNTFVCVVDPDGYFDGILTRRAILKLLKKEIYTSKWFKK
ncbi:CBS domain-containing protein [Compostibacillus humi]|uniref:CBS domain-containing protein n=1 Tax=Compostibacillus humi TaxID=1245525 RepID=A0A8J2ZR77_9BACI|nr:cyclic-di-AMP-binding protein CbpB [Compostibacillus humi]GGH72106.1 CBS domain-containing protein [Compostibacillus humi]HLT55741.1 cyclic-di-AMP-binding protein CbpB [Bacillota bacterium]